ncbi:zinc metalloproteinase nas-4-like [Penaeus japonicus]|uniref:zinc metalloproteinase nas-4-like n=1 Tax=Penaeus japonicus TaxID=27405 RepID=UPI001C71107C|nr:zinc metalloproteinase nas-4-like [Penaeus japonicus]
MRTLEVLSGVTFAVTVLAELSRSLPQPQLPRVIIGDPNDPENDILGPPLAKEELVFRADEGASEAAGGGDDPTLRSGFFQGDIMLPSKDHLLQIIQGSPDAQGSAARNPALRWPGALIPYVISASFSRAERAVIGGAMGEYHSKTCLRFVPRESQHSSYVHILKGEGCSSAVGRSGGLQVVSLGQGCVYHGVVVHEFMHAAGFWHEQSRYDRDQHVTINWKNIIGDMKYNFDKKTNRLTSDLGLGYDYASVMHYGSRAFAVDASRPTIVPKVPGVEIGQRRGFSQLDVKSLNILYRCDEGKPTLPPTPTEKPGDCTDAHAACPKWAANGVCVRSPVFMSRTCRRSCNLCDEKVECVDTNIHCAWWAGQGECKQNPSYMTSSCPRSCNTCGGWPGPCKDQHRDCNKWAARGECGRNPAYMSRNCRSSCRLCGKPPKAPKV